MSVPVDRPTQSVTKCHVGTSIWFVTTYGWVVHEEKSVTLAPATHTVSGIDAHVRFGSLALNVKQSVLSPGEDDVGSRQIV